MSEQKQYMLIFTLGPVQSLIAQARKTRDLWLGSFLLSKLMEAGMEDIDKLADTFVFPTERKIIGDIPDLPNKYIAIFNSSEAAEQSAIRSEFQIAVNWQKICDDIRDNILGNHYKKEDVRKTWDRQTNYRNFFEVFWVIVEGSQVDYQNWLRAAQSALDARKHLRDFRPQDEPGEKSTISGEREALHEKGTSRQAMQDFWEKLASQEFISAKDISKDGSERLDAIDTVKRFAFYSAALKPINDLETELKRLDFPSTSSIATASFVAKLLQADINSTVLTDWHKMTASLVTASPNAIPYLKKRAGEREWMLQRDGDCYFPEAFTPRYLKRNYGITTNNEEKLEESKLIFKGKNFIPACLKALNELLQAVGSRPTPYYALVQMDGDCMSTILHNVSTLEDHRAISAALSRFAHEVPQIIQVNHPGRLVYAGGDDVLAFTPLDGMLEMIDTLQKRYKEVVREPVSKIDKEKVTTSMGIAIAHHFTPLSMVRRAALEAEKLAKDRYNRDALVVTVIRRSGEQTRVGCHWSYKNPENGTEDIYPITLFKDFYGYFVNNILSSKSIHILLSEASTLVWLDRPEQISEIKRVLKRQRNDRKKEQLSDKRIEDLAKQLINLATAMDIANKGKQQGDKGNSLSIELHEDRLRYGLVETFGWLLVMDFLAREGQEV